MQRDYDKTLLPSSHAAFLLFLMRAFFFHAFSARYSSLPLAQFTKTFTFASHFDLLSGSTFLFCAPSLAACSFLLRAATAIKRRQRLISPFICEKLFHFYARAMLTQKHFRRLRCFSDYSSDDASMIPGLPLLSFFLRGACRHAR